MHHARLVIAEDNAAVIKTLQKRKTQALRRLHRTHRICVGWLYETMLHESRYVKHVPYRRSIGRYADQTSFERTSLEESVAC